MLRNFEELKKQLTQLASVINLYKNESVQLKIVELVFQQTADEADDDLKALPTTIRRRRRKDKTATESKSKPEPTDRKTPRAGRLGAVGALNRLLDEGYFQSKRKIGDVIKHCRLKLATSIKVTDMSGPLARFVREGKLDRHEDSEGQFEYFKK